MPLDPQSKTKSSLRRVLRQQRLAISATTRKRAARQVERLALRHRLLGRGKRLGFYIPTKGELDILPTLNRALWLGGHCYLPVLPGPRLKKLWFTRLGTGGRWQPNRYGIPEYHPAMGRHRAGRLDILFLPMLGFDLRGYRMGMGGGYYDATLAFRNTRRAWLRPRLVGVGFEIQRLDYLPADPWDIPLDAVITERRYYRFARQ